MGAVPATPENIARAAEVLRGGGVVAFPTETVYGLGANALDPQAVARIFEIKQRPAFDPLIVHIANSDMLEDVVADFTPLMLRLSARFWPGPLTLIARRAPGIPAIVTAGLDTVAVRMPAHPVAIEVIERANVPVAAPSANPFGYVSPTRAAHVERSLGDAIDLILDGGPTEHGIESTILALEPVPRILRYGAIPSEEIERIAGPLVAATRSNAVPEAPGNLPQHYAPRVPVRIVDFANVPAAGRSDAAALAFGAEPEGYAAVRNLSPSSNLREAAAALFDALQELERLGITRIDAPEFPHHGLGLAIADRLGRASVHRA
jgi:L-threonylcarbamoyladenylate synthase